MTAASELSLSQVIVRIYDLQREVAVHGSAQDYRNEAIGLAIVGFSRLEQNEKNAKALGSFVLSLLHETDLATIIDQVGIYLETN